MFEDQSSVDEKIYSMEVGEKEECWEEERERENSVRLPSAINPDARRPTPDARRPTPDARRPTPRWIWNHYAGKLQ